MVLEFSGGGLIGNPSPEVSPDGSMYITGSGNIIEQSVITGDLTTGIISQIYDNDLTTYAGSGKLYQPSYTHYINFDLQRYRTNLIIDLYYGINVTSIVGGCDAYFQSSKNNVDWTTLCTISRSAIGETTKSYSGKVNARYLRMVQAVATSAYDRQANVRIYNLRCSLVG